MVMLDFICMDTAELIGMGETSEKFKKKICFLRESNQRIYAFQRYALDCLATEADVLLWLKKNTRVDTKYQIEYG